MSDQKSEVKVIANALRRLDYLVSVLEQHHREFLPVDDVIRDIITELLPRIDKIERGLALLLAGQKTDDVGLDKLTGPLRSELVENHIASLKRQLVQQYQNLNSLKEDAAVYGAEPPLHTRNKITAIRVEIDRLEIELEYFETL